MSPSPAGAVLHCTKNGTKISSIQKHLVHSYVFWSRNLGVVKKRNEICGERRLDKKCGASSSSAQACGVSLPLT